jgi:hypothetical protein
VARVASRAQVAGGDEQLADLGREAPGIPPIHQLIAGQLLGHEAIVRLVLIARPTAA